MENREHNIFNWRTVWLIVMASVLDVLMWVVFNNDYRANLLFNKSYPSSVEFVIDLSITLFESGFLIITGSLSGRVIARHLCGFGKYGLPLVITAVFILLYLLSAGISFLYFGVFCYYGYQEFILSVLILGALSSLFTLIMISDDMLDMIRRIDTVRKEVQDKETKARKQLAITELEKDNVLADNHFLFNCMGIVYAEIEENPQEAKMTMENLLSVTRYMSSNSNVPVVSLKNELEFLEWYLMLTGKRHPYVKVDVSGLKTDMGGYVVPISIQGLVENAVKHNSHDSENPLTIYVSKAGSRIEVRNRIQPLVSLPGTTGRGLELLKARYRDLTDEPVIVSRKENEFTVSIPLLFDSNMKTGQL